MDEGCPNPQKTELMIIGHPLSTRKPELSETLELNGSEIKRAEKPSVWDLLLMKSKSCIVMSSLSELEIK